MVGCVRPGSTWCFRNQGSCSERLTAIFFVRSRSSVSAKGCDAGNHTTKGELGASKGKHFASVVNGSKQGDARIRLLKPSVGLAKSATTAGDAAAIFFCRHPSFRFFVFSSPSASPSCFILASFCVCASSFDS